MRGLRPRWRTVFVLAEVEGLTNREIGWLDGAFMAAYALGQVPGGLAGDLALYQEILGPVTSP